MSLTKVKENKNLFRDETSGAILNIDKRSYQDYIDQRQRLKDQNNLMVNNQRDIENLKNDVSEIKNLLQVIANRLQETK